MKIFQDKTVVITGGTGSLGKILTKRLLSGKNGLPKKIIIFSRDEAKQHYMQQEYLNKKFSTDETIYNNFKNLLEFRIGDIRNYHSVLGTIKNCDILINAAALKQVPSCEYFPFEAVETNITGAQNIVRAIQENNLNINTVVGVSTDKACKPVNVMGMTKALQERIFISANIFSDKTRYICVRYGNVLASRGSVIPMFLEQINSGGPVTITDKKMTRFLLTLENAVDTIVYAITKARRGDIVVPKISSSNIYNVAKSLINNKNIKIIFTGIRPGEKVDEIMVSDEESLRSFDFGNFIIIKSMLPELVLSEKISEPLLSEEYSSKNNVMSLKETINYLNKFQFNVKGKDGDLLV